MLTLTLEQGQRLSALARERGIGRIGDALAAAFPAVATRAGPRLAALVVHGVERAAAHGLDDAVCVARYLACWFVWGPDFESQPGGEWARAILVAPTRTQGAKAFQLCRRTAERLLGQPPTAVPGAPTSAAFQAAVGLLDDRLADVGVLGSLVPTPPVQLGVACDIDACDLRLVDVAWRQSYRHDGDGRWQRLPSPPANEPVVVLATNRDPDGEAQEARTAFPPRVHLLSPSPGDGAPARLRLRSRATHVCDPEVHPQVTLNGAQGLSAWRGPFATEVVFALAAGPVAPALPPGALEPAVAVATPPMHAVLEVDTCGLRETGAPLATLATQVWIYPAAQWLLSWQREPSPGVQVVPETAPSSPAIARPVARCRVERDGTPIDPGGWQAALQALDAQWSQALSGLPVVWERASRVTGGRVEAEASLMTGSAGLTWGWAEGERGLVDAPILRVDGRCDLTACAVRLQFTGELVFGGSRSRLRLTVDGSSRLATAWQCDAAQPDLAAAIKPVQVAWRHPFRLDLVPLADDGLAIARLDGPVGGALVGACGLRQRGDGPGLQWFARLAIEAASVPLRVHDPLLGLQRSVRPLLPDCVLVDWSLG